MKNILLIPIVFLISSNYVFTQKLSMQRINVLFIVDASFSMGSKLGNENKMNVVASGMKTLIDKMLNYPEFQYALRMYGHQSPQYNYDCIDSKLEVPFGSVNASGVIKYKVERTIPTGTSPVAYALSLYKNDFPEDGNKRYIVLITDGADACNGDICKEQTNVENDKSVSGLYVISIGISDKDKTAFTCINRYKNASNITELQTIFQEVLDMIKPY
ncbi:MAG: VWA domain-containing protein [Bacteroidales bacterium]